MPDQLRECRDCGVQKPLHRFGRVKKGGEQRRPECKDCKNRAQREDYACRKPEARKNWRLQKTYGITLERWNEMFEAQDGLCAICGVREATDTDHDHETGKVRDLLCNQCNKGLGHMNDDPLLLAAASTYLVRHGKPMLVAV